MTIAVDWDVKPQTKQYKNTPHSEWPKLNGAIITHVSVYGPWSLSIDACMTSSGHASHYTTDYLLCVTGPVLQQFATVWPGITRGMATDTKVDNPSYNAKVSCMHQCLWGMDQILIPFAQKKSI